MALTPPYPTATIYVPWDSLEDSLDEALSDTALTVQSLSVTDDAVVGGDLGVAGEVVAPTIRAGTAFYERGRVEGLGEWVDVPFSAGDFTADVGTWTVASGNVGLNRYTLIGKTAFWAIQINAATLAGSPVHLLIAVPFSVVRIFNSPCAIATDGTPTFLDAFVLEYSGALAVRRRDSNPWVNGVNNYLSFTAICELS